jgi:hypothetical protein
MTPTTGTSRANRQTDLLERAGRYLAGGGLGLFVLPPEVNLVIAEGHGSHVTDVLGRDFIDYHPGSGPALRACPSGCRRRCPVPVAQGLDLLFPQRASYRIG